MRCRLMNSMDNEFIDHFPFDSRFDIDKDPGELSPVTDNPSYQDALNQHREYLKEWIGKTQDDFPLAQIPGG